MLKYTRFRQYLARNEEDKRARDMRNPYGSRGGYVRSDKAYSEDMARGMNRDGTRRAGNFDYVTTEDMARGRDRAGDMARGMNRDRIDYDMDYADYADYNDYADYGDYARDRHENQFKLTPSEIRKWTKEIEKVSGGNLYTVEQVKQIAQQNGIKFDEYRPEVLTVMANAQCSDYKNSVKGDMATYVKMARDFLEDADFDGEPEEKAYLYYKAIVSKED